MENKNLQHMLTILDAEEKNEMSHVVKPVDKFILEDAKNQCPLWHIDNACDVLGRQYKSTLLTLYPLLRHIERYTYNNVVYISQTNRNLLPFYSNSHERIYYLIHKVLIEKAKVLYDLESEYRAHYTAKNYYVCIENLNTMLELYARVKEEKEPLLGIGDSRTLFKDDEYEYKLNPVYLNYPSLSLNSALSVHEFYSFEEVKLALFQHYSYFSYYQYLVEILNKKISRADEKIQFDIKPKYSNKGKISKLGIRAFSRICLLKSSEKHKKKCDLLGIDAVADPNIKYREQYLKERFGEYEEYDVHASVPRVSRAMATNGDMGDLDEDLYRTMFEPFVEDYHKYINPSVTEWCDEVRQFFKMIFMRLFFGGTPKQIARNILDREGKEANKAIQRGENTENLTPFSNIIQQGFDLVGIIAKWQNTVYEYCGRSKSNRHDTSVFLHESCIYLEVRLELAKRGIDVVQVYDGFYFKKGTMPDDMDEIIKSAALEYYRANKKVALFNISNSIENLPKAKRMCMIKNISRILTPADISPDDMVDLVAPNVIFVNPDKILTNNVYNYKSTISSEGI